MGSQVLKRKKKSRLNASLDFEELLRDTYAMHLQLSQYDGLGDGQGPSWSCPEDLYEFCFLGRGQE